MKLPFLKKKTEQLDDTELLMLDPYCPECDDYLGTDITGTIKQRFCPDCGAKLILPSRCVWCNNLVNPTAKFCTGCGMIIKR